MLVDKLNGLYKENILNTNINGELGLNGLIIGPVGSGKTASVDEWCSTLDKDEDELSEIIFKRLVEKIKSNKH